MEDIIKLIDTIYKQGKITIKDKNELTEYLNTNPNNLPLIKKELEKLLEQEEIEITELTILSEQIILLEEKKYKITAYSDQTISLNKENDITPIPLYNFKNPLNKIEFDKLENEEKEQLYLVMSTYENEYIMSNLKENIHIIINKNIILTVIKENDQYKIKVLNQKEESQNPHKKTNQKNLGSHPGAGKMFKIEEDGFFNILLIIFLTGMSMGMTLMLILNIIMK